ncbi:MAG: LamG domain-containing protein [Akkermansiaceae bacterium]|nr:LamG domain-containing protein [Akkermansiaceae bacterium]
MLAAASFIGASHADLIGHWAFDEGVDAIAADSSGQGNNATITNGTWGTDATRNSYLIFNGIDSVVDPNLTLPVMDTTNDFTWALWVNSQEVIGGTQQNAILIGNRFDAAGVDFAPRQFIKITPTKFEWHQNGNGNDNLDVDDLIVGQWHHIAVVKTGANLEYFFDGLSVGTSTLTEVIGTAAHPLFIGGHSNLVPADPEYEHFNGFIDDVRIYDEALSEEEVQALLGPGNLSPSFTESPLISMDATVGTPYAATIGDKVADANLGDILTITKLDGPAWLTVGSDGTLSGDALAADAGLNRFTVQVSDGDLSSTTTLHLIVIDPDATAPANGLFGCWPLNDGSGDVAADTSGNNFDAIITNADTGGLGIDGSVWAEDIDFGTVLSFNGANGTGAFATVGLPPSFGMLPAMDLDSEFTWSLWARSEQAVNNDTINDTILGNRYAPDGSEYNPREFIKFTTNQFEFHTSGVGQNIDYDDLVIGEWNHHVAIKDGSDLSYYRNGVLVSSSIITEAPLNQLPMYFGGFGLENWQGYLSDVKLWERAISTGEVLTIYNDKILGAEEVIQITQIIVSGNNDVSLTWTSRSGTNYILESSTDLSNAGGWDEIDDSIIATGDTTTVNLPGNVFPNASTETKLFFRVRKPAP